MLELGSGTALPGLLCSKLGAKKVFLSDDMWQPNTIHNCNEAIKVNGLSDDKISALGLTWGEFSPSGLLRPELQHQVLITVQERSADWSIEEHLLRWKLKCSYVYPSEFLSGTGVDESDLIGGHTIFILKVFSA